MFSKSWYSQKVIFLWAALNLKTCFLIVFYRFCLKKNLNFFNDLTLCLDIYDVLILYFKINIILMHILIILKYTLQKTSHWQFFFAICNFPILNIGIDKLYQISQIWLLLEEPKNVDFPTTQLSQTSTKMKL